MRKFINDGWEFTKEFDYDFLHGDKPGDKVIVPHTCAETAFNHWDSSEYEMVCGYRRRLKAEPEWKNKRVVLRFMGAGHLATVYFNGEEVAEHACGYTEFAVELTDKIRYDEDNYIVVRLDTRENLNIPPFGYVIDYMTYGGLYRDVVVDVLENTYLEDVFLRTDHKGHLECDIESNGENKSLTARLQVTDQLSKIVYTDSKNLTDGKTAIIGDINDIRAWTTDSPVLYNFKIQLCDKDNVLDEKVIKSGFRTAQFRADGFYLNDRKMKLIGLNRHQSFAYVGYAMPASMQRLDADILKKELGVNIARTSHYPQSQYFIERCDEIGLLVFTEIPGWQHIGDEDWKNQAVENTREMIMQYRNHPSIILWGVRINESQDDDEFYTRTNALARSLDPTRATTGVRYLEKSSLLEDVYAFNDFSHVGNNPGLKDKKKVSPDMAKGYIVSECNGHMYPTKPYDCEEHRLSHSLRHAAVIEAMSASEDIAGVHGWCMFDYNTHKDFGSGDGICYHGVMDMFRNPKMAAAVYASQSDERAVCEVSSSMDIGEHPAGSIGDVYVFTNADSIRLYKNDIFVKEFYPDRETYGHMPHPPVIINDFIGELLETQEKYPRKLAEDIKTSLQAIAKYGQSNLPFKYMLKVGKLMAFKHFKFADGMELYGKYVANWGGSAPKYRFEAIKDGAVVKTVTKQPGSSIRLVAEADHTSLVEENTYDAALIRIRAVDEYDNVRPYFMEPVELEASGDIEIVGPKVISLKGGMGGTYVKSVPGGSQGILTIRNAQTTEIKIIFSIE